MNKLDEEIGQWGEYLKDRVVSTVFIGGGTPSILSKGHLVRLCDRVKESFHLEPDAEFSMEANPGTTDAEKLQACRDAGINRLSFGLQSTEAEELAYLGRIHSYEQFLQSYEEARNAGFQNINVDLMSAIPKQTLQSYERTLRRIGTLHPEHISAYSLIVEEGTGFAANPRLKDDLPSEEDEVRMYAMTREILKTYGYHKYEISNYALKGKECRHNLGYWSAVPYLGVGLNASSYMGERRYSNPSRMKEYMETEKFTSAYETAEKLQETARIEEFMFLGLRKTEGVSKLKFQEMFHRPMDNLYGDVIENAEERGWLKQKNDKVMLTEEGILISNQVLCEFLL